MDRVCTAPRGPGRLSLSSWEPSAPAPPGPDQWGRRGGDKALGRGSVWLAMETEIRLGVGDTARNPQSCCLGPAVVLDSPSLAGCAVGRARGLGLGTQCRSTVGEIRSCAPAEACPSLIALSEPDPNSSSGPPSDPAVLPGAWGVAPGPETPQSGLEVEGFAGTSQV